MALKDVLETVFSRLQTFDAKQCLEMGLIDEVIY
jgi:ATP-dependent protease ClpP protease subunit